jgi:hypothetical protein
MATASYKGIAIGKMHEWISSGGKHHSQCLIFDHWDLFRAYVVGCVKHRDTVVFLEKTYDHGSMVKVLTSKGVIGWLPYTKNEWEILR